MENNRKSGRLLSVNWQDGMLIKSIHFDEQEDYFENLNRWTNRNTAVFYGLARSAEISGQSFDMRIEHDGENWVVILSKCNAFTASGKIIQIDSEFENSIKTEPIVFGDADIIPIYVHASGAKINIGAREGGDLPTRYPYRIYDYRLIVGNAVDVDPIDCLKIGEIIINNDRPELSLDYIPPCSTIGAHHALSDHCHRFRGILTQAQKNALNGFRAFIAAGQSEGGKFGPEHKLLQDILSGLSIKLGTMSKTHPRPDLPLSPYYLITYYKEIFGTVESMLETYGDAADMLKKKYMNDELYNKFIERVTVFTNTSYNHQEIGRILKVLTILLNEFVEFINLIADLAGALPKAGKILRYKQKEYRILSFSSITTQPERDGLTITVKGLNNVVTRDVITSINKDLFEGADYRYIMVKIGVNENNTPGRMDPVNIDADTSPDNLIFKPMDDLKSSSLDIVNLNLRGNFNPQVLSKLSAENLAIYIY